jgi:nucleotide-binding universal stress UspA family protein
MSRTIKKILVALDASPHSTAALESAARMAAQLEAELVGLFVEDINLVRLAALPCAREVGIFSATARGLDARAMERTMRATAEQAERMLEATARRSGVPWSFRTTRGSIADELLAAALEADLLALGRASTESRGRRRLGSTALSVLMETPRPVLLFQHALAVKGPVMVVLGETLLSQERLALALALARASAEELVVLTMSDKPDANERVQRKVSVTLKSAGAKIRYRAVRGGDVGALLQAVRDERVGAVLLINARRLLGEENFQRIIEQIECPVFLVK